MPRGHELTDEQWNALQELLPGKKGDPGVTAKDNRLFVNAIFFVAKMGIPWRDLPERFGYWHNVSFHCLSRALGCAAIRDRRGGVSTKIYVAVDGLGKPTKIFLSAGQDHDVSKAPELIQGSDGRGATRYEKTARNFLILQRYG